MHILFISIVNLPGIYSFDGISVAEFGFEKISRLFEILISYFIFDLRLFDGVYFKYFKALVIFLRVLKFGRSIPSII